METNEIRNQLDRAIAYLRTYLSERPHDKIQIAYLNLQVNHFGDLLMKRELAQRFLSKEAALGNHR